MTLKWEQMMRKINCCVTSKFKVFGHQEPCLCTYYWSITIYSAYFLTDIQANPRSVTLGNFYPDI
jgi:hypothetical protein